MTYFFPPRGKSRRFRNFERYWILILYYTRLNMQISNNGQLELIVSNLQCFKPVLYFADVPCCFSWALRLVSCIEPCFLYFVLYVIFTWRWKNIWLADVKSLSRASYSINCLENVLQPRNNYRWSLFSAMDERFSQSLRRIYLNAKLQIFLSIFLTAIS